MRRPRLISTLLVLLLPLAAGCAGPDADGVGEEAPLFRGAEELRVGSLDDPDYALTRISSLAVAEDGTMYTAHDQESIIRKFGPDGDLEATMGKQGDGPGEFQRLYRIGIHGDSLWAMDLRSYRFSFFRDDGFSSSFTVQIRFERGVSPSRPYGLLEDGSLHGAVSVPSMMVVSGEITDYVLTRMNRDAEVTDTLLVYPIGNTTWGLNFGDRGGIYGSQPWGDGPIGQIAPDGSTFLLERYAYESGDSEPAFRLTHRSAAGDTLFSRSYGYELTPLPPAVVDSVLDGRAESWSEIRQETSYDEMRERLAEALFVPEFLPPVDGMVLGRDGTVWLKPYALGDAETLRWLMLDASGDVEAYVDLPADLRVLATDRRNVWGSTTDELDVPYLVRYRVEPVDGAG